MGEPNLHQEDMTVANTKGTPKNAPSKTGQPSGKGKGNNPPKK